MSIATEITRLQGIKTDIRNALVTQGISQATSHNMADFSADILAIQGGSEGVYIEVKCKDAAYQGYDIILYANEIELDRKQCPSSLIVNFFVSADDVTLPTIFTIGNNHPYYSSIITKNFEALMYGWYYEELDIRTYLLTPNDYHTENGGWRVGNGNTAVWQSDGALKLARPDGADYLALIHNNRFNGYSKLCCEYYSSTSSDNELAATESLSIRTILANNSNTPSVVELSINSVEARPVFLLSSIISGFVHYVYITNIWLE